MSQFAHDIQRLFLDPDAPAARDYLLLDELDPAEIETARPLWAQTSLARRLKIVQALLELGEEDLEVDFWPFFRLALDDPDDRVRFMALEGLWEDEDPRLIPRLIDLLQHDPAEGVRAAAAASLARFVFLGEMDVLKDPITRPLQAALLDAIRNPAEAGEVRRRALEALAYADRPEMPDLIAAAYQDPDPLMRVSAVFAMGRACDPAWTDTAITELSNPDPAMRFEAARACGEIEAEEALPALVRTLSDPDLEVREMVVWALGEIGGEAARRALKQCLQDPNPGIQEAAQDALDELAFYESGALVAPLDFSMLPSADGNN
ncbi:MAG: HEAT repeat domain-containing protein [Chloroflexi bacterium]|nr:HEAT repeat domain-containing protein [Chloroflexota bacterium]MBU1749860.1 HEAT repeat domain-containing protein [Chloroflexota bacterium]MBU1879158.1 HEAT repeat domain-containing protein [Chloroflexota bacterium]